MKLHVLDLGKIVMMGDNPVTSVSDTEDKPAIPIHAFLLESPVGNILFDTGCAPGAMEGVWPKAMCSNLYIPSPGGDLVQRLEQIGVKPEDVDIVVASHLHLDHGGGLHLFPKAKVMVAQQELDTVLAQEKAGTLGIFHLPCDLENWRRGNIRWEKVTEPETAICDGVAVLNLGPGHSYGMLGMLIRLESGPVLLVADALYAAVHYGPPARLSGAVVDEPGYFQSIERIRGYVQELDAKLFFGHDMDQFLSLKKAPDGYYE